MFLIDKYSINDPWDVIFNKEMYMKLLKLDSLNSWLDNSYNSKNFDNLPNILIYGNEGSGKNSLINLFLKRLYVKDMVVVDENLMGNNGVIHVIDCIMFVQPSSEDDRVSKELEEDFPITSCCMREKKEIESFKKSARNKF